MRDTKSIATAADHEAAIAALAEEYARRRIVEEMYQAEGRTDSGKAGDHTSQQAEDDCWQDVEDTAYYIDSVTLNPKDRMRFDDEGHVLDGGRFQPLLALVIDTLDRLHVRFKGARDPQRDWPAYAVRHLLDSLLLALAAVEQENQARRRKLGDQLASELGLALATEIDGQVESGVNEERSAPAAAPSSAEKPLRSIRQFDAWSDFPPGDSFVKPDKDGHALTTIKAREPRRTDSTVRVQVLEGADKADVLALLRKVSSWIERDGEIRVASIPTDDDTPF